MSISPKSSPHLNVSQPKFCIYFSSTLNKCDLPASVIILTILGKEYKLWHASLHNSLVPLSLSHGLHPIHPSPVLPAQWKLTDCLEQSSYWESNSSSGSPGIPTFYGTLKFITALTRACQITLSWAWSIQSMHPTLHKTNYLKIHFNIILPSMPIHLIILDLVTQIILRSTGH